jgi:hypothetical protein
MAQRLAGAALILAAVALTVWSGPR